MRLEREIEEPARYLLRVEWDAVDGHMVGFRTSPPSRSGARGRGAFFTAPPVVLHSETVAQHF